MPAFIAAFAFMGLIGLAALLTSNMRTQVGINPSKGAHWHEPHYTWKGRFRNTVQDTPGYWCVEEH